MEVLIFLLILAAGIKGLLSEVLICAAVSFARCPILMKTAPYLNTLPERLVKEVKSLSFPLHCSIIMTAVFLVEFDHYKQFASLLSERIIMLTGIILFSIGAVISAKYAFRTSSFLCLELCNGVMLTIFLHGSTTNLPGIVTATSSVFVGMILLFTLQRHFFQQKPFKCLHVGPASAAVAVACIFVMISYVSAVIFSENYPNMWMIPVAAVMYIILWITVVCLVRRQHNYNKNRCCPKWRGLGYMCCAVLLSISVLANGMLYLYYIWEYMRSEDYSGYLALTAVLHILPPASLLDHPRNIKKIPHVIFYMFGTSGLSIVTSLTLGSELILKAGTAERTLPQMHIIILPFESLFVFGWLALLIYDSWMRMRGRIKRNFEDEEEAEAQAGEGGEEMEVRASLTKTPES